LSHKWSKLIYIISITNIERDKYINISTKAENKLKELSNWKNGYNVIISIIYKLHDGTRRQCQLPRKCRFPTIRFPWQDNLNVLSRISPFFHCHDIIASFFSSCTGTSCCERVHEKYTCFLMFNRIYNRDHVIDNYGIWRSLYLRNWNVFL